MGQTDEDFRREIESHLELETERLIAEGVSPAEARDLAMRRFGNVTRTREHFYYRRRVRWWSEVCHDLRLGVRALSRAPLFALTAILSIAIGIGLDLTVFTVVKDLLVQPPAGVVDVDRLVDITEGNDYGINEVSLATYRNVTNATTLADVTAYKPFPELMSMVIGEGAERVFGHKVSASYFAVHGVRAASGRLFHSAESGSAEPTDSVVLSDAFWARRFNRDSSLVGSTLLLNQRRTYVIGIAGQGFSGTSVLAADLWTVLEPSLSEGPLAESGLGWALVRARLEPGVNMGGRCSGGRDADERR